MSKGRITVLGLVQAIGTVLYVAFVVLVISCLSNLIELPDNRVLEYLGPVGFLLLFIVSASISGSLVIGYPVVLALRQQLKEAILLVAATISWIALFTLAVMAIILAVASRTQV